MVNYVYFLLKGKAAFVLPRFENEIYIIINEGDHFGLVDIIPEENKKKKNKRKKNKKKEGWEMKRRYSVQAIAKSELMALKTEDLTLLQAEFPEIYEEFFTTAFKRTKMF